MIADSAQTLAVSSLGWVDRGALWVYRNDREAVTRTPLSDAEYLSLHPGRNDWFSIIHHYDTKRLEITAHRFSQLEERAAQVVVEGNEGRFLGESDVWRDLPRQYVAYLRGASWSDYALISLHLEEHRIELQRFAWFDDTYDQAYQGVIGVTEIPGSALVIVSVQRDSRPVVYDPASRLKRGEITLANRGGNPTLYFRRTAKELWADDYDTVLKLDADTFAVLASRRVQGAATGTGQFIGRFSFDPSETLCLVARPFSGDVVGLDTRTLKKRYRCRTGAQPLEASLFPRNRVVARDWKSGDLLQGTLQRTWGL